MFIEKQIESRKKGIQRYVLVGAIGAGVVTVGGMRYYIRASNKYKQL